MYGCTLHVETLFKIGFIPAMQREMEQLYGRSSLSPRTIYSGLLLLSLQREMEEMYGASRERHAGLAGQLDRQVLLF